MCPIILELRIVRVFILIAAIEFRRAIFRIQRILVTRDIRVIDTGISVFQNNIKSMKKKKRRTHFASWPLLLGSREDSILQENSITLNIFFFFVIKYNL